MFFVVNNEMAGKYHACVRCSNCSWTQGQRMQNIEWRFLFSRHRRTRRRGDISGNSNCLVAISRFQLLCFHICSFYNFKFLKCPVVHISIFEHIWFSVSLSHRADRQFQYRGKSSRGYFWHFESNLILCAEKWNHSVIFRKRRPMTTSSASPLKRVIAHSPGKFLWFEKANFYDRPSF